MITSFLVSSLPAPIWLWDFHSSFLQDGWSAILPWKRERSLGQGESPLSDTTFANYKSTRPIALFDPLRRKHKLVLFGVIFDIIKEFDISGDF
jgi:hypothetical protein